MQACIVAGVALFLSGAGRSAAKHADFCNDCTSEKLACFKSLPADADDDWYHEYTPVARDECDARCVSALGERGLPIAHALSVWDRCEAQFNRDMRRCLYEQVRNGTNGCSTDKYYEREDVELGLDAVKKHVNQLYLESGANECINDCYGSGGCGGQSAANGTYFNPYRYYNRTRRGAFVEECGCIAEMGHTHVCEAQVIAEKGNICECAAKEIPELECTVGGTRWQGAVTQANKCRCDNPAQAECIKRQTVRFEPELPDVPHPCEHKCAAVCDWEQGKRMNETILACRNELGRQATHCVNEGIRRGAYGCYPLSSDGRRNGDSGNGPLWELAAAIDERCFDACVNECFAQDTPYYPSPLRHTRTFTEGWSPTPSFINECGCYGDIRYHAFDQCRRQIEPGFLCQCVAKQFPQLKCE